jgi:hypothetical protein
VGGAMARDAYSAVKVPHISQVVIVMRPPIDFTTNNQNTPETIDAV